MCINSRNVCHRAGWGVLFQRWRLGTWQVFRCKRIWNVSGRWRWMQWKCQLWCVWWKQLNCYLQSKKFKRLTSQLMWKTWRLQLRWMSETIVLFVEGGKSVPHMDMQQSKASSEWLSPSVCNYIEWNICKNKQKSDQELEHFEFSVMNYLERIKQRWANIGPNEPIISSTEDDDTNIGLRVQY